VRPLDNQQLSGEHVRQRVCKTVPVSMSILDDFRYAWRTMRRSPGFTAAAIVMLTLAIAASTSIFSVVHAVLLRQLPFKDPGRLVLLWGTDNSSLSGRSQVSAIDASDWEHRSHSFDGIALYQGRTLMLTGSGDAQRLSGLRVSNDYFEVMLAKPRLGRFFAANEYHQGSDAVAVLAYDFWRQHFNGDPSIVGQTISLNYRTYTVVGIAPPDLHALPAALTQRFIATQIYVPLAGPLDEATELSRTGRHLRAIARLKAGASVASAQSDLDVVQAGMIHEHPKEDAGSGVRVVTLREDMVSNVRTALLILQFAVLVVVLIACANVANLLLARSTARQREIAVRAAMGASRARIMRQMIVESVTLAAVGGAAGLLVAGWATSAIAAFGTRVLPQLNGIEISTPVVAFAIVLSLVTGIVFGAAPAAHASTASLCDALKSGARTAGPSASHRRTRALLIASEVGLSLVLLVCAGLLLRSFMRLQHVDTGLDTGGVVVTDISLPSVKYPEVPQQQRFFQELLRRGRALPGVQAVAIVSTLPDSGDFDSVTMEIKGRTFRPGEEPGPDRYIVSPEYFHVFRIPLLKGRAFSTDDDGAHPRVVIVNQRLAETLFPGQQPIGQQVRIPTPGTFAPGHLPYWTIVGIVGNTQQYGLDSQQTMQIYVPYLQYDVEGAALLLRAVGDPLALRGSAKAAVAAIDKDVYAGEPSTMDAVLADSIAAQRFSMTLLAVFGLGALILAALGIYSVVSFVAVQRTAELGLRMALGAGPREIVRLVIAQGMRPVATGMLAGLAVSAAATRAIQPLLFETGRADTAANLAALVVLAASALLACYLPARRTSRIDPLAALRAE
jgi:putative ABC transport system permease protein